MGVLGWLGGNTGNTTDVNEPLNYSTGSLPTAGDDLYIEANPSGTDYPMAVNLSALAAVALASLNISQTFGQTIGTSSAYFQIKASTVNIGYQFGAISLANGSQRVKINLGSSAGVINIYNSANSAADPNVSPIQLLGSALTSLNITSGLVCMAVHPGETSTVATITNGGGLTLGAGVTVTTVNGSAGSTVLRSAATTVNMEGGNLITAGTGAIGTMNIYATASATLYASGTITALNVVGKVDMSQDAQAKTITTVTQSFGSSFNIDNGIKGSITITNPIIYQKCRPSECVFVTWIGTTITPG